MLRRDRSGRKSRGSRRRSGTRRRGNDLLTRLRSFHVLRRKDPHRQQRFIHSYFYFYSYFHSSSGRYHQILHHHLLDLPRVNLDQEGRRRRSGGSNLHLPLGHQWRGCPFHLDRSRSCSHRYQLPGLPSSLRPGLEVRRRDGIRRRRRRK